MVLTGRIELTLNLVAGAPCQATPSRQALWSRRRVEPVRDRDTKKIADHVAVVKVVPEEDFDFHGGAPDSSAQGTLEPALDANQELRREALVPVSGVLPADAVQLDPGCGTALAGPSQQVPHVLVARLGPAAACQATGRFAEARRELRLCALQRPAGSR